MFTLHTFMPRVRVLELVTQGDVCMCPCSETYNKTMTKYLFLVTLKTQNLFYIFMGT